MSHDQQGPEGPRPPGVGSVGEEAAKLFGVLSGWAREQAEAAPDPAGDPPTAQDPGAAVHGLADALGDLVTNLGEHVATGGEDCRYCPVCQVIHVVRDTNPEVKQQLLSAASSLLRAAAGMLATHPPGPTSPGVEKIDLSDDGPWEGEQ